MEAFLIVVGLLLMIVAIVFFEAANLNKEEALKKTDDDIRLIYKHLEKRMNQIGCASLFLSIIIFITAACWSKP